MCSDPRPWAQILSPQYLSKQEGAESKYVPTAAHGEPGILHGWKDHVPGGPVVQQSGTKAGLNRGKTGPQEPSSVLNRCWGLELRAPVCTFNSFLLLHYRKAWSSMGSTARSQQPRRRRRPLTSPHRPTAEPAPKAANLTGKGA